MIIYIVIKIAALLGIIVLAIKGPQKQKLERLQGNSDLFIHGDGSVQYSKGRYASHQES